MHYSLRIGLQSYSVDIEDLDTRPVIVEVDGERFEVWPEEALLANPKMTTLELSQPVSPPSKPCLAAPIPQAAGLTNSTTAPIPGVIVAVTAKPGQSVKRGDELCVLEAMKMKNSIRAGRDGKVKTIFVVVGDQVCHGQTLIEFTD